MDKKQQQQRNVHFTQFYHRSLLLFAAAVNILSQYANCMQIPSSLLSLVKVFGVFEL